MNNKFPWKELELNKFITSDKAVCYYHFQPSLKKYKNTIVMLLAWNMSPDVFSPLLLTNEKIKKYYNVYIFVLRGYIKGVDYGNNITRCTMDLREFIKSRKLNNFIILGHSIGNAILWNYLMNYGQKLIHKFILIDEMTRILKNPANSKKENLDYGSITPTNQIFDAYNTLIKGNLESFNYRNNSILSQFSDNFKLNNPHIIKKILKKVNLYTYDSSANILYSNQATDWIEQLLHKNIKIPTYLFGGEKSVVPYQSIQYQKKFYLDSEIHIFTGPNSSHFAFIENYELFNELLNKFL